jgi:FkbM family methyltransferase
MGLRKYWFLAKNFVLAQQKLSPSKRQAARRALGWKYLKGQAETITFERNGIVWTGHVRSAITASLFHEGGYQHENFSPLLAWLEQHGVTWPRSKTIVNVGANIGDTCICLALQTGKKLIACEPVPDTFQFLERNVRNNRLEDRISCHQVAIASAIGTLEFVSPSEPGNSEVRTADGVQGFGEAGPDCPVARAQSLTLDALLQAEGQPAHEVGLVWSDTQGFESEIIASGPALWKAGVPLWVEVWPKGLQIHGGVDRFLKLCTAYFHGFIPGDQLQHGKENADAQSLDALEKLMGRLHGRNFTDVLLVP